MRQGERTKAEACIQKEVLELVSPAPSSIEQTGLRRDLLVHLAMKILYFAGEATGAFLADRMKLPYSIVDDLITILRSERFCEVRGVEGVTRAFYRYALTPLGKERTLDFMSLNQYAGPAPVPLAQYSEMVRRQSVLGKVFSRQLLEDCLSHLVISEDVMDKLGPAVNSGRAIFLYGAPGNGKTAIAEGIGRAFGTVGAGNIFIPHAIEVNNHIIRIYDPINHLHVAADMAGSGLDPNMDYDLRWMLCKRPTITVGGELNLRMLDLSYKEFTKAYEAPLHIKANGGVFLIDDFGRQLVSPVELLNRWIVPLEKRVDYLTLHTGEKFPVPFDCLVIFSTNLEPADLVDEAFLRRIPYKIKIDDPTLEEYARIFRNYCEARGLEFDPQVIEHLYEGYYRKYNLPLRRSHPRDLIEQVISLAVFNQARPELSPQALDRACSSYFILGR